MHANFKWKQNMLIKTDESIVFIELWGYKN